MDEHMTAAVVDRYGPPEVVGLDTVPRPVPGPDDVLVSVRAVAVTSGDARIRGARFPPGFGPLARLAFGITRPRRPILGSSFSGVVTAVGRNVGELAAGERVCGMTGMKMGAHAEFVAVPAKRIAHTPPTVNDEDAAGLLFGGTTALYFLRDKAAVGPGTSVLVNGASGAIGTNAVQLAAHLGATVTAVTSGPNAELVTRLGATRVVDHTVRDVTTIPERFDVVMDTVGNLSIASGRRLLAPGGKLLLVVAGLGELLRARGDVAAGTSRERVEDVEYLLRLVADGTLAVIHDRILGLDQIVDAHRLVDSGRKVGNVVVRPSIEP